MFEVGAGPYHYYDTTGDSYVNTPTGPEASYENAHGWGLLTSAAMDWYFQHGWFAMLRVNDIEAAGRVRSAALAAGFGYRFGGDSDAHFHWSDSWFVTDSPRVEIDGLVGRVVLNSFHSDDSSAQAISLRTKLSRHFAASLTYTLAHDAPLDWHSGAAIQLWTETALTRAFSAGVGLGAFITGEKSDGAAASGDSKPAGIFGVTLAYGLGERWLARAIWIRVATRDDNDSDIVLVGVGYRF